MNEDQIKSLFEDWWNRPNRPKIGLVLDEQDKSAFEAIFSIACEAACAWMMGKADPVGKAVEMPGTNGGFTMCAFEAKDVPLGARLYTAPPIQNTKGENNEGCGACHDDCKDRGQCEVLESSPPCEGTERFNVLRDGLLKGISVERISIEDFYKSDSTDSEREILLPELPDMLRNFDITEQIALEDHIRAAVLLDRKGRL